MTDKRIKRKVAAIMVAVAVLAISLSTTSQIARAQMGNSNMSGGGSGQNQTNMMMGANITGSVALGPTIAKAIASQVHVSLGNASTIAEKAVGANAHAAAVRIGVVHGFLVYMALVLDSNNNFHGVIVDPGNGKVLGSTPISFAALGMMMGMGGSMMGMMMSHGMSGYGMGMMQPGMMKGPGMMMGHP
jgi:hypothetical protein